MWMILLSYNIRIKFEETVLERLQVALIHRGAGKTHKILIRKRAQ